MLNVPVFRLQILVWLGGHLHLDQAQRECGGFDLVHGMDGSLLCHGPLRRKLPALVRVLWREPEELECGGGVHKMSTPCHTAGVAVRRLIRPSWLWLNKTPRGPKEAILCIYSSHKADYSVESSK